MQTVELGVTGQGLPTGRSNKKLPTRAVMTRYDVSDRTIDRWTADETLGFPKPFYIRRRRYWREEDLDLFDKRLMQTEARETA
jgi:predicted DNA-binding transcriptional regulator AlpA